MDELENEKITNVNQVSVLMLDGDHSKNSRDQGNLEEQLKLSPGRKFKMTNDVFLSYSNLSKRP